MSLYQELSAISVKEYTEQKGKFTYLSWCFAVQELLKRVPDATWEMPEPTVLADGSMIVWCKLTADGITRTAYLPVMDNYNKAISKPDAFAVNKAMQRCLAKAIALHGLGLYIYAGEDLPEVTDYMVAQQKLDNNDPLAFREWLETIGEERLTAAYNDAPKGEKVKWKSRVDDEIRKGEAILSDYETQLLGVIKREDAEGFAQLWDEMSPMVKRTMNARLNAEQKSVAKALMAHLGGEE